MEKIRNTKIISFTIALLAGLLLFLYSWAIKIKNFVQPIASADSCVDDTSAIAKQEKQNPNAHLFISCGGFLE